MPIHFTLLFMRKSHNYTTLSRVSHRVCCLGSTIYSTIFDPLTLGRIWLHSESSWNVKQPRPSDLSVYGDGSDMAQTNTPRVCLVHPTLVPWPAYICIPGGKTLLGALSAARLSICSPAYSTTAVPTKMHSRHNQLLRGKFTCLL